MDPVALGVRLVGAGHRVSTGSGPFGQEMAVTAPPAWSPTLIFAPVPGPDAIPGRTPASRVRGGRGTIRP